MDEHRWQVNGREAVADCIGIRYQTIVGGKADYIVGGTIANEEIMRLAEIAERTEQGRLELLAENRRLAEENARLLELLNPRQWTKATHDAWHAALPNVTAAFDALRFRAPHSGTTACVAAERARIRRDLETWYEHDTGEESFPQAFARICPEEG